MPEHTQGPWSVGGSLIVGGEHRTTHVARVLYRFRDECPPDHSDLAPENTSESDANRHLIAAAPELLAACKQLMHILGPDTDDESFDWVKDVIAKATT